MGIENTTSTGPTLVDSVNYLGSGKATVQQAQEIISQLNEHHEELDRLWNPITTRLQEQNELVVSFLKSRGDELEISRTTGDQGTKIEIVNYRVVTTVKEEESVIRVRNMFLRRADGALVISNVLQTADFDQNSLAIDDSEQSNHPFKCVDGTEMEYPLFTRRYCVVGSTKQGYARAIFPNVKSPVFTVEVNPDQCELAINYFQKKIIKALKNPTTRIEQ